VVNRGGPGNLVEINNNLKKGTGGDEFNCYFIIFSNELNCSLLVNVENIFLEF